MSTDPKSDRIRDRVRAMAGELLAVALTPEQDEIMLNDLDPDRYNSLGVLDFVASIEQQFEVSIEVVDDDLEVTFRSVASISALVGRKLADAKAMQWQA
jgi:acyl carrier protein